MIYFPTWLPYLIIYFLWLKKRKPHRVLKSYNFPSGKYIVHVNRYNLVSQIRHKDNGQCKD